CSLPGGWLLCPVRPAGGAPPHARAHRAGGGPGCRPARLRDGLRWAGGGPSPLPPPRRVAGAPAESAPLPPTPAPPAGPAAPAAAGGMATSQAQPVAARHRADASADPALLPTPPALPAALAAAPAPSTPRRRQSAHWHRARHVLPTTYLTLQRQRE